MTKTVAAVSIAVALALCGDAPGAASRDLWIGVVSLLGPFASDSKLGTSSLDPSTFLQPVAALVDGRWSSSSNEEWPPTWSPLPTDWQAHLLNQRPVRLRTSGPLYPVDGQAGPVVNTNFKRHRTERLDTDNEPLGIAVVGDVRVQLFVDLPESERLRVTSSSAQGDRKTPQEIDLSRSRHVNGFTDFIAL